MTNRRQFLAGMAAMALPQPTWADVGNPAYLAAAKEGEAYFLHGLTAMGESLFALPLPARGHAAAAHPTLPLAVGFARRPGSFALVVNCATGAQTAELTPPVGRQFNGHGTFSADGAVLYTSEVVAETSEGRIGLWETGHFTRIGEWASGGIGPHDIKRMGQTLIVANGGIATDPTDRRKLNLGTMRPNLTQLSADGEVLAMAEFPDLPQNSIRHLSLGSDGQIAFAMQWEGDPAVSAPALGLWTPGTALRLCPAPDHEAHRMKGYAGSIAQSGDGRFALTSSKGGVAMVFDAMGQHLETLERADISGVARRGAGLVFSDGSGALLALEQQGLVPLAKGPTLWDNHLVSL